MNSTTALATAVPIEPELARLRSLQKAGRHGEAAAGAQALLRAAPENRDLLLMAAIGLRGLGRFDDALATLDALAALHPRFSRLHQ